MTPELKYKIERCATLLAGSPLDESIKKVIVENISNMTEQDVDRLLLSLGRETMELKALADEFQNFDKKQEEGWKDTEKMQVEAVDKAIENALKSVSV